MIRIASLSVVLCIAAFGCTTGPYEAVTDCPKEINCGQCASRGACAWCGEARDNGGGRCVAVGHGECEAPLVWQKTPDRCPLPPEDAGAAPASTSSETAQSSMKDAVTPAKFEEIRTTLQRSFPDAKITDTVVGSVIAVLVADQAHFGKAGIKDAKDHELAPISKRVKEKEHPLYLGHADHHRVRSMPPEAKPMESEFSLPVPMVRVRLPETLEGDNPVISTAVGDVYLSKDHLLGSIDLLTSKYGGPDYLGYRPERVDLITPARGLGTRFGAIAIYLGYKKRTDKGPSFYMFEAGTATGDPKMIYFSPDFRPIKDAVSHYLPTGFVSTHNRYSGYVKMRPAPDEDEPELLYIESRAPGATDPYITVKLNYERAREFELPVPAELTLDAAARIAVIAETMGVSNAVELQKVLAQIGKDFSWIERPRYVTPAPTAAPTVTPAATPTATPTVTPTAAPAATPAPPR
ncbi:MAG: hypothetical protein U0359_04750 [Byssovorax sp.]